MGPQIATTLAAIGFAESPRGAPFFWGISCVSGYTAPP